MDSLKLSLSLEFLLGNSSRKISQISHAKQGLFYICGCYIVFYSPFVDEQVSYIKHRNSNISAIAVSPDQRLLAVAETGKYPSIYIYSIELALSLGNNVELKPQFILKGHKQSIDLIKFSPNSKYLVSVCNSDGSMFIWQNDQCISRNKSAKLVHVLLFDWNHDLLTIGMGYIKLWKFDNGNILRKKQGDYWMIEGKLVSLGKNFNSKNYIDCAIFQNKGQQQNQKLILLSSEGFLCTISHAYDKIQKWVDLGMPNATSLQIYQDLALCAGENAVIKIIDLINLSLRGKFPKPPPLNNQNITNDDQLEIKQDEKFPSCLGILIFSNFILTLYENGTIFVWTMDEDIRAFRSIITHKQKINCVSLLQQIHGDICFFATAAQDNTLRIWHFYTKCYEQNRESIDIAEIIGIKRNAYCKNLTRIIYTDAQHPIIKVKLFMKKYIVCISKREFLMYSLETYALILYENFQNQFKSVSFKSPDIVLSLQSSEDLVYLGFQNGFLKVYKPSQQSLLKLKEIDFGDSIQQLCLIGQRKILVQCNNRATIFDFQSNSKNSINGIVRSSSCEKYLFLGEERKIVYYSVIKNRKVGQLSLVHEFDVNQTVKAITNNSSLVAILSTQNRLIIANYSATIIYSETLNQQITDLVITETGHLLLTGAEGNIIIKKIADSKYKKIEQKAKKWFEMNDMSWMDNSIWASKEFNSHSIIKNKLSDNSAARINQSLTLLSEIDKAKSINMGNAPGDQSINSGQIQSVQYQYKNEQNKMSIFNPSNISKQVNQIYANVNGLMKNLTNKGIQQKKINFSGDLEDDFFKNSLSMAQKQKKRIFDEESGHYPRFSNNLVQSQMAQIKQTVEDSKLINEKNSRISSIHTGRSKSSSPGYSRVQQDSETLQYSVEVGQFKEGNVNNSLKLSQNFLKKSAESVQKEDQTIHIFNQIALASEQSPQNLDLQYLKNLVENHSEKFNRIYLVLDKIYGGKKKQGPSLQSETQSSFADKEKILQEYKKMSQGYLQFLESHL